MSDAVNDQQPHRAGHDGGWLEAIHPHFSPDITLGHLLQAVVVVTTVGGGILAGYLSLRDDLDRQRAEFSVSIAEHEARLTIDEHELDERHTEQRQFQAEMRSRLQQVMQAIADLRTALVEKEDRKER
jgi:hypothetical protein